MPSLRGSARRALSLFVTLSLASFATNAKANLVIEELFLSCADGSSEAQFIEIENTDATFTTDTRFRLRAFDQTGALLGEQQIFEVSGVPIPEHAHVLVATPGFATRFLMGPDLTLPFSLDPVAGVIRLIYRDDASGQDLVQQTVAYGTPATPLPAPGLSLARLADGQFVAAPATPQNFSGVSPEPNSCVAPVSFSGLRIQELFTRCRSGLVTQPFLELVNTGPMTIFSPVLGLRATGSDGAPRFDIPNLCGTLSGLWSTNQSFLVSSAVFPEPGGDRAPDRVAPLPFDPLGGRVTLYRTTATGTVPIQTLIYGTGGAPIPPPGSSLERQPNGAYVVRELPAPRTSTGVTMRLLDCGGPCPQNRIADIDPNAPEYSVDPQRFVTFGGDSANYDMTRGLLHIDSELHGYLETNDKFRVEGLPAGTPVTLTAEWTGFAVANFRCFSGIKDCAGTQVLLLVQHVGGNYEYAGRNQSANVTARAQVTTTAGTEFPMLVSASILHWGGSPPETGVLDGRLRFTGLPSGARVVSCYGYDSSLPVAAELALADASVSDGVAHVRWFAAGDRPQVALERRRSDAGDWAAVATLAPDGEGFYSYADAGLVAGTRVGYRLVWSESGARRTSSETWLDVPSTLAFALRGLRPNPSAGASTLAFALDRAGDVRAEVIDIAGRRVLERRWTLAPGEHALSFMRAGELRPGMYLVRLSSAGRAATTRAIVTP